MTKVVALLPIKAHSERVPGKNFRLINGKPLYQWILNTLTQSKLISRVVINTDSNDFISELRSLYPEVTAYLRPGSICGDLVPMNHIINYDIEKCNDHEHFLQTHTTNPLLSIATINNAIFEYFSRLDQCDSLFSVNRIQSRCYWRDGKPINHELGKMLRTQDMEPVMEENSNLFIFSRNTFKKSKSRIGEKPYLFETPKNESFEIDEEEDFVLVENFLKNRSNY